MKRFFDLPLREKMLVIILVTNGAVVLLLAAALLTYELYTFRGRMETKLAGLCEIVGASCAYALATEDKSTVDRTLSRLAMSPEIVCAAFYRHDGAPFASYRRPGDPHEMLPASAGSTKERDIGRDVEVFRMIRHDNRFLGTVYARGDRGALHARLRVGAGIVLGTALMMAVGGAVILLMLQGSVSGPILELARTVTDFSEQKDYSVRAEPHGADEIGQLADNVNHMFAQIQQRDEALTRTHDELEARVEQRTEALGRSNEELERFNRLAVGREHRMIELKQKINDMLAESDRDPAFDLSFAEGEGATNDSAEQS